MKISSDPWLAGLFGHPVYKVVISPSTVPQEVARWLGGLQGRAFAFAKVGVQEVGTVAALCAAGFAVVDVNMTWERLPGGPRAEGAGAVCVRPARGEDREAVLAVAANSFVFSRFHLDPLVPNELANRIKEAWMASYFAGRRGERVLVAEAAGEPVGFLAVLGAEDQGRRVQVIDLIGVARAHQGKGLGRALVEVFAAEAAGHCELLRVGTQAANVPSSNLYGRCGFHVAEAAYVLHVHVEEGSVLHAYR